MLIESSAYATPCYCVTTDEPAAHVLAYAQTLSDAACAAADDAERLPWGSDGAQTDEQRAAWRRADDLTTAAYAAEGQIAYLTISR